MQAFARRVSRFQLNFVVFYYAGSITDDFEAQIVDEKEFCHKIIKVKNAG